VAAFHTGGSVLRSAAPASPRAPRLEPQLALDRRPRPRALTLSKSVRRGTRRWRAASWWRRGLEERPGSD